MIQFALTSLIFLAFQAILVLGLNVQFGLTGILNLAYIVFYAAGAYTAGILTGPPPTPPGLTYIGGWNLPFYVGILGAMVVAGLLSALVGAVALSRRLRGSYLAITTLVVAVVALQVVSQAQGLFDGSLGLLDVPLPFGRGLSSGAFAYLYTGFMIVVVAICFAVSARLRRAPFGRVLRVIREDEVAASVFGYNIFKFKLIAFTYGGVLAGLGRLPDHLLRRVLQPGGLGRGRDAVHPDLRVRGRGRQHARRPDRRQRHLAGVRAAHHAAADAAERPLADPGRARHAHPAAADPGPAVPPDRDPARAAAPAGLPPQGGGRRCPGGARRR